MRVRFRLLVDGGTGGGFPKECFSTRKWETKALARYVPLARLRSSSAGVSLGPLRLLNNAGYSLSRELISCKRSNQCWRAWRALKERLRSQFVVTHKKETVKASFSRLNWATEDSKSTIYHLFIILGNAGAEIRDHWLCFVLIFGGK